jgi:hypothetical protein
MARNRSAEMWSLLGSGAAPLRICSRFQNTHFGHLIQVNGGLGSLGLYMQLPGIE